MLEDAMGDRVVADFYNVAHRFPGLSARPLFLR